MYLIIKALWFVLVYLLGSIPFGLLLGRIFCRVDIRKVGSGNIGATNVARVCGAGWGVLTLLLDAAKGIVPVAMVLYVLPQHLPEVFSAEGMADIATYTALAAILGHLYSVFLRFKGGKAVATTVGVYLVLIPIHLAVAAILCIVAIKCWGFVSIGSLILVSVMPVLLIFSGMFTQNFDYFFLSVCIAVLVVYNHRGNIVRLISGEEKPWQKYEPTVEKSSEDDVAAAKQAEVKPEAAAPAASGPADPNSPKTG
jgi:glycerol-3-phosphate acyltransferase PlsY